LPTSEDLNGLYNEVYYGRERRKFFSAIESAIAALTRLKWERLRPLLQRGDRLLDIGCGRGATVHLARAAGIEAYGLERHFPGAPLSPNIFYQDLSDCKFPNDHFQVIILWHVLEHLPDPVAALREIDRILRPCGWLSVAVPNFGGAQARASASRWFHLDLPRHFWQFEPDSLEKILDLAGFRIARCSTLSIEYDWYGTLQSWMNRLIDDNDRLYSLLKGRSTFTVAGKAAELALATALAPPALASALWDAARGQGGTLTLLAQKPSKSA
jgi:SAM-dependent methyltransferase